MSTADAVDGLGGRFEGADSIRQGALEAAIFADRASKGIAEIVEEAATGDSKQWPSTFASLYKGRSVIIEAPISANSRPDRQGSSYQITYPIYFGEGTKPGRQRANRPDRLQALELAQPKLDEMQLFGARYTSVEMDTTSGEVDRYLRAQQWRLYHPHQGRSRRSSGQLSSRPRSLAHDRRMPRHGRRRSPPVPTSSSPADQRAELVGRELVRDDRVRYFLESKRNQGFDQFLLERADVLFRAPNSPRFARSPSEPNARVLGTLKLEDSRLVFDVRRSSYCRPILSDWSTNWPRSVRRITKQANLGSGRSEEARN